MSKKITRRELLRYAGLSAAGVVLAACAPTVVKETVEVEVPVKETVIVEASPQVVKETVIVEASPQVVTATPPPAVSAKITVWGWPTAVMRSPNEEGKDVLVERVKEDTGIEIEQTLFDYIDYMAGLKTAIPGGTGPDVCASDWDLMGPYWNFMTRLNALGEAEWNSSWKEDLFIQPALDEMRVVGGIVGEPDEAFYLPGNMQLLGWLYYWLEDFEKHNIDASSMKTWDDFEAACITLKDAGLIPLSGAADTAAYIDWFQSLVEVTAPGGQIEKVERGHGKWTDPGIVEAFVLEKKTYDEWSPEGIIGGELDSAGDMFLRHDVVMCMFYTGTPWFGYLLSDNPQTKEDINNHWGTFKVPGSKGLAGTDAGLTIPKESKQKEAAWEFLKWTSVGKGAQYKAAAGEPMAAKAIETALPGTPFDENLGKPLLTALKEGDNKFRRILCSDVYRALEDVIPGVITEQLSAADAAAEVQKVQDARCGQWYD